MELILPIIVLVTVLVLGGRDGMNAPSRPALEPESIQEFCDGNHKSGCKVSGHRHRDLTIPYPSRNQSGLEGCGGDR